MFQDTNNYYYKEKLKEFSNIFDKFFRFHDIKREKLH